MKKKFQKLECEVISLFTDEIISCSGPAPVKTAGIAHHHDEMTSFDDGDGMTY